MAVVRLLRLAAATVLVAAAGVTLAEPASAADPCGGGDGVAVVVDFSKIGGKVAATCVSGGGGQKAWDLLEVSHALEPDAAYPSVVCMVDSAPSDAECDQMPPANAYWGLFWSDGQKDWTYSSQGARSLTIPAGGWVGMAWQDGGSQDQPRLHPPGEDSPSANPEPSAQSSGDAGAGRQPASGPTTAASASSSPQSPAAASSVSPSSTPSSEAPRHDGRHRDGDGASKAGSDDKGKHEKRAPSSPTADESETVVTDDPSDALPTADPADASADRLPTWVMPTLLAGIFATAGAIALERRRRRG